MHQHPPKTPLFSSTSAANASHVVSSSALVVYAVATSYALSRNASTRSMSSFVAAGSYAGSEESAKRCSSPG